MIKKIFKDCTKQVAKVGNAVINRFKPKRSSEEKEEIDKVWEECKSDAVRICNDIRELLKKE